MKIKISVITVSLNVGSTIGKTIQSVLNQTYPNYEIIVKDGLSSDDTLQNIPESEKILVVSAKDTGIYNAMNEAVKYASGDYLLFLNAGDVLYSNNVFEEMVQEIDAYPSDVFYGDYVRKGIIIHQPSCLKKFTIFRNALNHQSMFFLGSIFKDGEWYDESYKILADYELTVRLFCNGKRFRHVPLIIDEYEGNGFSESTDGLKKNKEEMEIIRKNYFPKEYFFYKLLISMTLVRLRQWIVKDTTPTFITALYRHLSNVINR